MDLYPAAYIVEVISGMTGAAVSGTTVRDDECAIFKA
jgi:hypothetical protein